jgi:hypothetical protein
VCLSRTRCSLGTSTAKTGPTRAGGATRPDRQLGCCRGYRAVRGDFRAASTQVTPVGHDRIRSQRAALRGDAMNVTSDRNRRRPLWRCGGCGRRFANRNQRHSCLVWRLEWHFVGRSAEVRAIFNAFLAELRSLGPVTVLPERTRIAFQTRMSFAQLTLRRKWVTGHLVLARRAGSPQFTKIETISPRNHVHHFRLNVLSALGPELRGHMAEAYRVGNQEHLRSRTRSDG